MKELIEDKAVFYGVKNGMILIGITQQFSASVRYWRNCKNKLMKKKQEPL